MTVHKVRKMYSPVHGQQGLSLAENVNDMLNDSVKPSEIKMYQRQALILNPTAHFICE